MSQIVGKLKPHFLETTQDLCFGFCLNRFFGPNLKHFPFE